MFVTKRKHEEIVLQYQAAHEADTLLIDRLAEQLRERNAELAEFRAKRARANANLIPGGRRKTA